ncbi:MAG TPA: hypothetical protein VG318_00755 [Actinomycetota bacterium]|nr:hypothetical protein [Actinomycetota bacterium]
MDLRGWMLASRARYAMVWTATTVIIILGAKAVSNSSFSARYWMLAIPALLVNFVLNAAVAYPRAKRRFTARTG